ncbi:MAG: SIR2 family protein [Chitinophagales bacterium]
MSHIGIAIIENNDKYLVIEHEGKSQFWWTKFGARFEFDKFKKGLKKAFNINLERASYDFIKETDWLPEIPATTIYKVFLFDDDIEIIDKQIEQKTNWKWLNKNSLEQSAWKKEQEWIIQEIKYYDSPPQLGKSFLSSIEKLQKAQLSGKLVIFAGAGISKDSGVPMWGELVKELKEDSDIEDWENDYQVIPQLYKNDRTIKEYNEKIRSILKYKQTHFNSIHKAIVKLNPLHIITTNYDDLLEQAVKEDASSYYIVKKDKDLPYSATSNLLIKMHGDLEELNMVLTEEDYIDYSKNFPLIESFIRGIFASKVVLFVGFSFSDNNLKTIIQRIRHILQGDFQPAYLLCLDELSYQRKEYLKNKGIQPLRYNNEIEEYLKFIGKYGKENLDSKGQQTLNFLELIRLYDKYSDDNNQLHIHDSMYASLQRFKYLPSIPPRFLVQLTPFKGTVRNTSRHSYAKYTEGFHLETKNEKLIEFLTKVGTKKGRITYKNTLYEKCMKKNDRSFEVKIKSIFKHLNDSNIHCIRRKNDDSNENHNRVVLFSDKTCDCIKCLYYRLDFNNLLTNLKQNLSIKLATNHFNNHDLRESYGHFKVGNFNEAYFILKKLSRDSWLEENYILYFICKYNIVKLKRFVNGTLYTSEVGKDIRDVILEEINQIDIDAIIQKLPVEKQVKDVLISIKNRDLFVETSNIIDNNLDKVKNTYERYIRGGTESGPYNIGKIDEAFSVLFVFYTTNLLFEDELSDFKKIAIKYWEGLIVSYMTDNKYEQKIHEFHSLHLIAAILHTNPETLYDLLERYKVVFLNFMEGELKKIIDYSETFFKSNHTIVKFWGRKIYKNEILYEQINNSQYFKFRYRDMYRTLLLILSYAKLDTINKKELNVLIQSIFDHITVSDPVHLQQDKYSISFFKKQMYLFSEDNISRLIEFAINDNIWIEKPVKQVCSAIIKSKPTFRITSEKLIKRILERISPREKCIAYAIQILPFWSIIHKNYQHLFLDYINKELKENFDREFYFMAVKLGAIEYQEYDYFSLFLENSEKTFKYINDGHLNELGLPFKANDLRPWNYLNFLVRIIFYNNVSKKQYSFLTENNDLPLIVQWILDPENFEGELKPEWILFFNDEVILKALSKIDYIKDAIRKFLKESYNAKLSEIYFKYFA